ncbi:MAG: hypothetical protein V4738_13970 [Pseudomonadota bacterium]
MTHRLHTRFLLPIGLVLTLAACGGGGSGGSDSTTSGTTTIATASSGGGNLSATSLSPEATAAQRLNTERGACGFGTLQPNTLLDQAALNHANYNAYQASLGVLAGHVEAVGQPLFTGITLFDRALAVGYPYRDLWENVTTLYWRNVTGTLNTVSLATYADERTRGLLTSVYHLKGMLVATRDVGVAVLHKQFGTTVVRDMVVELGTQLLAPVPPAQTGVLTYPCEGTQAARAVFTPSGETPNPRPGFVGDIGTPIYLRAPGSDRISITSFAVTEWATGTAVPAQAMTLANDPAQWLSLNDAFILPDAPLTANVRYRVRVSGMAGSVAYSKDFSFTPS